jgi:hypothetical protein
MRIRSGHVSNSSTSNFVMLSFDVDPETIVAKLNELAGLPHDAEKWEAPERLNIRLVDHPENGAPGAGRCLVGIDVAASDENLYLDPLELSISQLAEMIVDMKRKLGIPDDVEAKILIGTRVC